MGWSTNQKALEKRAKEKEKKQANERQRKERIESEKWKDQLTEKKFEMAQQKEEKKLKQLEKKKQLRDIALLEEEEMEKQSNVFVDEGKKNRGEFNVKKITQAQLRERQEKALIERYEKQLQNDQEKYFKEDNPNHKFAGYEVANTVQQALSILQDKQEKHPEKRFKAAFEAFCQKRQPMIKIDYPKFKRSQRLQMMRKEFEKHPENPYNKKTVSYNYKANKNEESEESN